MKEQVKEILRDLIWAVLNGDDLDKWMEVRDSTSPDLQGFLDIYDSGIDQRAAQILALLSPKGEKPPVIEDTELRETVARYATVGFTSISYEGVMKLVPLIAEAQRDADEKWFMSQEGVKLYLDSAFKWERKKIAREIQGIVKDYFVMGNYDFCRKYLPYVVYDGGRAIAEAIESKHLKG